MLGPWSRPAVIALAIALGAADAPAQDKARRRIAWQPVKSRVTEYAFVTPGGRGPERTFWIFASELRDDGGNRLVVDRYADIPLALAFVLPSADVRVGDVWDHAPMFFHAAVYGEDGAMDGGWGGGGGGGGRGFQLVTPVRATGQYRVMRLDVDKKTGAETAQIRGEFTLFEVRQERGGDDPRLVVTKNDVGTVSLTTTIDVAKGVLRRAVWLYKARGFERVPDGQDTKVQPWKINAQETLELREEVDLDPAKMKRAIDAQVKKAAEWLAKQQQSGGEWATVNAPEDDRARASTTGLAVRALLASGAKGDDPAIDKAIRWLRNTPAGTPLATMWQLTAFAYRATPSTPFADADLAKMRAALREAIPKPDADLVRTLSAALVARRRSGLWGPLDRDDWTNIQSTRHAAEALSLATEIGAEVPADVWERLLDRLSTTLHETGGSVTLSCEGASFADKDTEENAKVKPAVWGNDILGEENGRRVHVFTMCAAAELLKLCEIELARRGPLSDTQRTSLGRAQRGAIAWLQRYASWRSPYPSESENSLRLLENAHALARVYTLYGITTVLGAPWHLEASYHLMRQQYADGRWDTGLGREQAETAWAVLTLTRGVLRPSPVP